MRFRIRTASSRPPPWTSAAVWQSLLPRRKGVSQKDITDEMMQEFKTAVTRILTPYASAILLDPEWGLPASKARAKNAGLLLAYENSGYDNTQPGRLPDLLPHVSVKRLKEDMGADAVKILIYYIAVRRSESERHQTCFHRAHRRGIRDIRNSVLSGIRRIRSAGRRRKGLRIREEETARSSKKSMEEFSKPQYKVDVLKVEVPVNANFVEGSSVFKGQAAYSRAEALDHFRRAASVAKKPFIYLSAGVSNAQFIESLGMAGGKRHRLFGRPLRARDMEGWHAHLRYERLEGAGGFPFHRRRQKHPGCQPGDHVRKIVEVEGRRRRCLNIDCCYF